MIWWWSCVLSLWYESIDLIPSDEWKKSSWWRPCWPFLDGIAPYKYNLKFLKCTTSCCLDKMTYRASVWFFKRVWRRRNSSSIEELYSEIIISCASVRGCGEIYKFSLWIAIEEMFIRSHPWILKWPKLKWKTADHNFGITNFAKNQPVPNEMS